MEDAYEDKLSLHHLRQTASLAGRIVPSKSERTEKNKMKNKRNGIVQKEQKKNKKNKK